MSETRDPNCPECDGIDRRQLLRYASIAPAAVAAGVALAPGRARAEGEELPKPRQQRQAGPAEDLVKELYAGMKDDQKKAVCLPFDDARRLSVNPNHALNKTIGSVFDDKQVELIERIVKAMSSGDELAWKQITRGGTWDASKTFKNTGANIFGDPAKGPFAFLFTGHHLTLRCDGNFKDSVAFGGPIYYGHTPNPYSDKNVFYYQTQEAMKFYDALNKKEREQATVAKGNPGEGAKSVKLPGAPRGVAYADLSSDQKELMEKVMHSMLSPFRKEDADEVMAVIKETGGLAKLQFAFFADEYENAKTSEKQPWSFWRIEGPGFVWNFRVLPHVHTYVNIAKV
jgi:hypothetical protein